MTVKKYKELYHTIKNHIPESRIIHDDLRLLALGTDASFYRLVPKLIVRANTEQDIQYVLKTCFTKNIPVTFRAAGTSLSGQAISDSVLVMIDHGWKACRILDNGEKIILQPGVIGSDANDVLLPYNRKIGPDPASINSAMIGGIVANNAGGMGCGTAEDSYHTISSMRIILNDGSLIDTGDKESVQRFKKSHPEFIQQINSLKAKVTKNKLLAERIRHKYRLKNTMGYNLNALVDFDDPIDILQHLMVGSEGTLGFISEITFNTVTEYPKKATSLIIFPDMENACKAVTKLKNYPVSAVELMDRASLRAVEEKEGMPSYLKDLGEEATALLVETRSFKDGILLEQIEKIKKALENIPTVLPIEFTQNLTDYTKLWNVRKGLFPSVAAMRKTGTTVIIEDVAFPISRLADATLELQRLFLKHKYDDAIIFGHALEGNFHFVFKQDFNKQEEILRYQKFIQDVTHMVAEKYDGSLKAEHGTGRNMASFVEMQWGKEGYELVKDIKNIFDPGNILNPGVIINDDPAIYIKNIKPLPQSHPLVDKCIECGFCEVHCVSNHLTLSARQRIVAYREICRLKAASEKRNHMLNLEQKYYYYGMDTCATDGLCALGCPVDIDTGKLIKELRFENNSKFSRYIAQVLATNMRFVTAAARIGFNFVYIVQLVTGQKLMSWLARAIRKLSFTKIPMWNPYLPKGACKIKPANSSQVHKSQNKVVYFPSCINRSMGISKDYDSKEELTKKTISLLDKAGFEIIFPDNLNNLCCGMAFSSKGFIKAGDQKAKELEAALLKASDDGKVPVLCDMSPCLYRMKETLDERLQLYEPIEFTLQYLVNHLKFEKKREMVVLHPVCSSKKMDLEEKFIKLAKMCAEPVIVPKINCCGFAGDRGFTFPELNKHGLRRLEGQISDNCSQGYSTSRTCEIGLSAQSGINYKSIFYLVDEVTTPN